MLVVLLLPVINVVIVFFFVRPMVLFYIAFSVMVGRGCLHETPRSRHGSPTASHPGLFAHTRAYDVTARIEQNPRRYIMFPILNLF